LLFMSKTTIAIDIKNREVFVKVSYLRNFFKKEKTIKRIPFSEIKSIVLTSKTIHPANARGGEQTDFSGIPKIKMYYEVELLYNIDSVLCLECYNENSFERKKTEIREKNRRLANVLGVKFLDLTNQ